MSRHKESESEVQKEYTHVICETPIREDTDTNISIQSPMLQPSQPPMIQASMQASIQNNVPKPFKPPETEPHSDSETNENNECPELPIQPQIGSFPYMYLPGPFKYTTHLSYWNVDEKQPSHSKFWQVYGKAIATKNLWISTSNLLLAFAVWLIWSVITVLLLESWESTNGEWYHFDSWHKDMTPHEYHHTLWLLPATAGLSGATLRLTNSFMIAPSGGRNVISQTSILLLIPMIMLAMALNNKDVSLEYLLICALITGAGGGACSSSLSNISFFYPQSKQGIALGIDAGIGNLGVSVMQLLVPLAISIPLFGTNAASFVGDVGYTSNAAIMWIPILIICIIFAWFGLNTLPQHPATKKTTIALTAFYYLEFLGYLGAMIAVLILISTRNWLVGINMHGLHTLQALILWIISVVVTVFSIKYLLFCGFFKDTKTNINKTLTVLSMKHTWIITNLYTMTFGSFIGFSASFGLLIKELFPHINPLHFAWIGPFVGSVARPLGGWLSDKYGGAKVTHWTIIIMILSTIGVGTTLIFASHPHEEPQQLFPVFLGLFLILFFFTGIGNGSTFKMVPSIFTNKEHAGPICGWAAAIGAYGAFVVQI
eukprot:525749_1